MRDYPRNGDTEASQFTSVDDEQLARALTAMAAQVIGCAQVELALAWLWAAGAGEPRPRISRNLRRILLFVADYGRREVEPGYTARDYFEDCLRLALRRSRAGDPVGGQPFA